MVDNSSDIRGEKHVGSFNSDSAAGQQKYCIGSKADPNPFQNCSEAINKMAEIKRLASRLFPPDEAHMLVCCAYRHSLDIGDNSPFDLV